MMVFSKYLHSDKKKRRLVLWALGFEILVKNDLLREIAKRRKIFYRQHMARRWKIGFPSFEKEKILITEENMANKRFVTLRSFWIKPLFWIKTGFGLSLYFIFENRENLDLFRCRTMKNVMRFSLTILFDIRSGFMKLHKMYLVI